MKHNCLNCRHCFSKDGQLGYCLPNEYAVNRRVVDRKNKNGTVTHSLVLPYSYVKELTPALQEMAVRYIGTIR